MNTQKLRKLVFAAAVGGLYAVLTIATAWLPFTYGPVQFRISEALCVLPFLFPHSSWGLFVGCILANLLSPYPLDIAVGALATLIAALCTARVRTKWLAPLPPVLANGLLVGALIAWYEAGFGPGFVPAFLFHALTVALGEVVICYALGLPLLAAVKRIPPLRKDAVQERLSK